MYQRAIRPTLLRGLVTLSLSICVLFVAQSIGARGAWEPVEEGERWSSGREVTEEYRVRSFDQVEISSAFDADIRQGPDHRVVVRVDEGLVAYLRVSEAGGILRVSLRPGIGARFRSARPHVQITMPLLRRIELSGAAQARLHDLRTSRPVEVELSGASGLTGEVDAPEVRVEAAGASRVSLRGSCEELWLDLSGASDAELTDFPAEELTAELSGASTAAVEVRDHLDLEASGGSRLFFAGDPQMGSIELSGASSLKALEP